MMDADIAIIGGGINGSSIAYHLALSGRAGKVVVIEPDPTYERAATPRSTGGVRRMFSIPECIAMSEYGHHIYGNFDTLMAIGDEAPGSINFRRQGYMWLGTGAAHVNQLIENWKIHAANGVRVEILDRNGVKKRFPSLSVDDVDAAIYSPDDGFLDPYSALIGTRKKAASLGAEYIKDRVVDFQVSGRRITGLVMGSGKTLKADVVVNAANCGGIELCEKLGMKVPVQPMRRLTFYFEVRQTLEPLPSVRHIGNNVAFRPEGKGYISGRTNYEEKFGFNWDVDHDWFTESIWPHLAERAKAFEELKVQSSWSCHYDQNTLDNNAIIGPWIGGCDNFYVVIGYSGHGLQHGPATGRAIKELLVDGGYQSLDLTRLSYQRIIDGRPLDDVSPYA
jgi:glycine/D-amino acid oxidase-like deaminating enzyme